MKLTLFLIVILSSQFVTFGQKSRTKPKPNTQTSTKTTSIPKPANYTRDTVFYSPEFVEDNTILVAGNPALTQKIVNQNIYFYELYFEMDFSSRQKEQFTELLKAKWKKNSAEQNDILNKSRIAENWLALDYDKVWSEILSSKTLETMENGMFMPDEPKSVLGKLKKEANKGDSVSVFLMQIYEKYDRFLAENRNTGAFPIRRIYTDYFTESMVFEANAVAGRKVVEATDEVKQQMADYWKAEFEKANQTNQFNIHYYLMGKYSFWKVLRHNKYKFPILKHFTNYQKKTSLRDWSNEVGQYFPTLQPDAEKRIAEYKYFVTTMTENEMQLEFYRIQAEGQNIQRMGEAMREQVNRNHANMQREMMKNDAVLSNGIENIKTFPTHYWKVIERP